MKYIAIVFLMLLGIVEFAFRAVMLVLMTLCVVPIIIVAEKGLIMEVITPVCFTLAARILEK